MNKKMLSAIFLLLVMSACSDDPGTEKNILADTTSGPAVQINRQVLDEMVRTLPQPIEIADIISKSNMEFSAAMLVPSDLSSSYADKYSQSLALGAYGVDLGYINLNEKTLYTLQYLESIKNIAEAIKVEQFFDFATLAELSKNRNNADSLIQLSTRNFNRIDEFLREKDRGELSVLILIGAWLEGMHMFGEIHKTNKSIETRIGEQKVIFGNISALMEKLNMVPYFASLKKDMNELQVAYDSVQITTVYKQPETQEVNGELVIIDKSETKVEITEATAEKIINSIEAIRKKHLLTTENK